MIQLADIYGAIGEAKGRGPYRVPSLEEILGRYERRKRMEVILFLLPKPIRKILGQEKWWLDTVRLWYWWHEAHGLDFAANFDFLVEKNKQYGSTQLYLMDTLGIWLRSFDKVERIRTIDSGTRTKLLQDESRIDSLLDLFNYAILALLVVRRKIT